MGRTAPIARLTLAYAGGVAGALLGAPPWLAPVLLFPILAPPTRSSVRPATRRSLALALLAGWLAGAATDRTSSTQDGCAAEGGAAASVEGRFLATPRGGSAPLLRADGCGELTVVVRGADTASAAGLPVRVRGSWRAGRLRPWLAADSITRLSPEGRDSVLGGVGLTLRWPLVRWRDRLVGRLHTLYGSRAPVVAALVLARREGLDPETREAFAVTGIAHLLAISGFHVGVIAGLVVALLRALAVARRRAVAAAAVVAWGYVALIGFPDAACRAALILAAVAVSRASGRAPTRWGALSASGLLLLVLDPRRLASAGFQLSFAGAAGLVAWSGPLERALSGWCRRRLGVARPGALSLAVALSSAVAAGVSATLATLPIVAWHFERVSLVGIPATLLASPLVSLALPGALASLAASWLWSPLGSFLAGGVTSLLDVLLALASWIGASPWASAAVGHPTVIAVLVGVVCAREIARRPGVGAPTRRRLTVIYALTGVVAWPLVVTLAQRGSLELWMIDVGQGDALALRGPGGRWMLVDAGPPHRGGGVHPVVRALRSRGVRTLDMLVLTHADADHFGGAVPVLRSFHVDRVVDPALAVGKEGYADVLAAARQVGVAWTPARRGQRYQHDGVTLDVLHPDEATVDGLAGGGAGVLPDANEASVVLRVEWRGFRALLTGDAYVDVERALAPEVGDVDVLKVGHHGSRTSTDSTFLAEVRPEWALLSVGRGNRYGHPAPEVTDRLRGAGAHILRTDLDGGVRLLVRRDGRIEVRSGR